MAWRTLLFGVFMLCGTGVLALVLGYLQGGMKLEGVALALTGGFLLGWAAVIASKRNETAAPAVKFGVWEVIAGAAFAVVALRIFLWVYYFKDDEPRVLLWNNMGDLSLHSLLIRYLANGASFWPENPILIQNPLGYSFGVDLINACLLRAGLGFGEGLVWMGLVGSLLTGIALFFWGRGFVVAGFLCNGGLAIVDLYTKGWIDLDRVVDWKSIPLALFATQRGFLYAFPAGLLLLLIWRDRHLPVEEGGSRLPFRLPFPFEWFIYASMPLFHLHTFIFLSLILAGLGLFGERRGAAFGLAGASLLPASLLIYKLTDGFTSGKHVAFQPGWLQEGKPFFGYWLLNFGIFLPLALSVVVWTGVHFWKERDARAWKSQFLLAAIPFAILLLTFFVRFAPWAWDNTKLIVWSYLMLLPPIWCLLLQVHVVARYVTIALLFVSGALSLAFGLNPDGNGTGIGDVKRSEIDRVGALVARLPAATRFAAAPEYNHPLLLNGRALALGYDGHLMSHGLDYQQKWAFLNVLMQGSVGWEEAARGLGIKYLFWGQWEERRWPDAEKQWQKCRVVASSPVGMVYELEYEE